MVRDVWLWSRKALEGSEIVSGFCQLENSVIPAVDGYWYFFSNLGRIRQRKERDGLHLSTAVPKIQWASNPDCPYGY